MSPIHVRLRCGADADELFELARAGQRVPGPAGPLSADQWLAWTPSHCPRPSPDMQEGLAGGGELCPRTKEPASMRVSDRESQCRCPRALGLEADGPRNQAR